jgi:hypothetical protein
MEILIATIVLCGTGLIFSNVKYGHKHVWVTQGTEVVHKYRYETDKMPVGRTSYVSQVCSGCGETRIVQHDGPWADG